MFGINIMCPRTVFLKAILNVTGAKVATILSVYVYLLGYMHLNFKV